jgi:hypothetical protein
MAQLPNQAETVYAGEFEEEPSADDLQQLAAKFNNNA